MKAKKSRSVSSTTATTSKNPKEKIKSNVTLSDEMIKRSLSFISSYDRTTLLACCKVSTKFNEIATPLLWKCFKFDPSSFKQSNDNTISNINTSVWQEKHLEMIQIFQLKTHSAKWCSELIKDTTSLSLPNLQTLRIHIQKKSGSFREFHKKGVENPCPLIMNLKPKTVIYSEDPSASIYLNPDKICSKIWSHIETLILIISPVLNYQDQHYIRKGFSLSKSYPKLKRLFIMYDPTVKTPQGSTGMNGQDFPYLWDLIMKNPKCQLILVNSGCTNLQWPEKYRSSIIDTQDSYQESFIKGLWNEIEERDMYKNYNDGDSNDKSDSSEEEEGGYNSNYDFMTLEEFIEKEYWFDWFDFEDMVKWKKANEKIDKKISKRKKRN
ncbi:uncharacterized protein L201_001786 [Kwoniella dendrophila CBS 6074]|uniref:F-box domain-containing protein n=1 Tax=Kwoniella dendrophila CBS 6074 TaxID=1295534 RepID=A0AAX4JPZ4_9TREE